MESVDLVDYSRQAEMNEETPVSMESQHVIVGCGGVGCWTALMLAMYGCRTLVLIDGDTIEASNLNRLPFPQTWIGQNKAIALRRLLHFIRPAMKIAVVNQHAAQTNFAGLKRIICDTASWVPALSQYVLLDCTDDVRIQQTLTRSTRSEGGYWRYIKIGYEGYRIGLYGRMDDTWVDETTYRPGYRTTRANALSSVMAGCMGLMSIWKNAPDQTVDLMSVINVPDVYGDEDDGEDDDEEGL